MSYAQRLTFPIDFVLDYPHVGHNRNVWGMKLLSFFLASRELDVFSKIEHNIIEAITITCCEY